MSKKIRFLMIANTCGTHGAPELVKTFETPAGLIY